ncbi:ESPR domain-containing protein [Variovorax boronicumulans]|uniref:ESPR domain-containing protein n=1 Tax=Variovorax boronicumulans TaxID=436515 RepID=UPI001C5609BD
MNKSYKTIWNESLGAWVAASELATGRSKSSRSRKATRAVLAAGILLQAGVMAPSVAVAGELDGGTVASKNQQLAYGPDSEVLGIGPGVAIGSNASVFANNAIAIGFNVRANSAASIVMGNDLTLDRESGGSAVFRPGGAAPSTLSPVTKSQDSFVFINGRNTVTNSSQGVAIAGTLTNAGGGSPLGRKPW